MAQKHLHELLQEDQEPFHLKNYIADRRPSAGTTTLQIKTRKPSVQKRSIYKQACFLSFNDSPDVRKSPFIDFPSPAKSPCKSPNKVFLHIPARTASILLDAAMRIQKQSNPKPKTQVKNGGFGLFGSILKKFRKSTGKCEKVQENGPIFRENGPIEMGISGSCSTVWSDQSNEEKSMDLETSSSCRSDMEEDYEDIDIERENEGFSFQNRFCSSPLSSPFRFALEKSPFSGCRTPEFLSPAASPRCDKKEERENNVAENMEKSRIEEEEEEEQFSPVSVLDPLFDDDDDDQEEYDEDEDIGAYAIVQRAKQQLLQKLHRFEKLAELGPIELEKIMAEEEEQDEEDNVKDEPQSSNINIDELIREVLGQFSLNFSKTSTDTKTLIADLIVEELREEEGGSGDGNEEEVVERVCNRLEEWKGVEYNTIDMMVEWDIRTEKEVYGWKNNNNHKQVMRQREMETETETEIEIEIAIFELLIEELWEEF